MRFTLLTGVCGVLALAAWGAAQTQEKGPPKKPLPFVMEMIKKSPDEFLKQYDKNTDRFLAQDELPPFLAKNFKAHDRNGDGLLNLDEIGAMLQTTRQFLAAQQPKLGEDVEAIVSNLLKQLDTDKDGKVSKKEAKGRLAETFDKLDVNKDSQLDRAELRAVARVMQDGKKGPGPGPALGNPFDFDAFDKNADGRLTREELRGTSWLPSFADIDTSGDGRIERREWEAYLRKSAEKK